MFDLIDPQQQYFEPMPKDMTEEERNEYLRQSLRFMTQGVILIFTAVIILAVMSLFLGCTPQKVVASDSNAHYVQDILQHIDSLAVSHSVTRQDSAWHETILRQFQSIREKSDTSHQVVVDTAGNIIRETLVINNVREVQSESDRQEHQVLVQRLAVMDSVMRVMQQQLTHSDSLLQQRQDTVVKEVEKPLSWWQQSQIWLGRLVLVALAVLAAWWVYRKRTWWLTVIRKVI